MRRRRPNQGAPPSRSSDDIEVHLLEALRHFEEGRTNLALAAAGEAVFLDPRRPDGYLLLGEFHLSEFELEEALVAFEQGRKKAKGAALVPSRDSGSARERWIESLVGIARCHLLAERPEPAAAAFREVLALDPEESLGVRELLAGTLLNLGQFQDALRVLEAGSAPTVAGRIVSALAHLEGEEIESAVLAFRGALLRNPYVLAALLGEEPADLALVHGSEEGTATYAEDLAGRLLPFLEPRPHHRGALAAIAGCGAVQDEVARAVALARELNREAAAAARTVLTRRLGDLRDPARLLASLAAVMEDLEIGPAVEGPGPPLDS